jgi:hypothetical protein
MISAGSFFKGVAMFCPGCGKQLAEDARFCSFCGRSAVPGTVNPPKTPQTQIAPSQLRPTRWRDHLDKAVWISLALLIGFAVIAVYRGRHTSAPPASSPVPVGQSTPHSPPSAAQRAAQIMEVRFSLEPTIERGPEGEVYIAGSTNLPDGMKIGAEVDGKWGTPTRRSDYAADEAILVRNGHFRSVGLMSGGKLQQCKRMPA